jgi:poly-gamma-glutamate synthesis protein (capsule biosynthesis protein)
MVAVSVAVLMFGVLVGHAVPAAGSRSVAEAATGSPRSFTVAASGDILLHRPLWASGAHYGRATGQRFDFRPMFAFVAPLVQRADLAICHLETPVAPPGEALSTYPLFGVPSEIAQAIAWAGYDRCSTASNHTLDRGTRGIDATLAALDAAGVDHSGSARSPIEAADVLLTVNGVRVAHLSYTYWFNGLRLPKGEPWRSNVLDPARVLADVALARSWGAEYVIVSAHWGDEARHAVSAFQDRVARAITGPGGADLVLGHHAHVVQPVGAVNGRWVVYGLGNHVSNMGASKMFGPPSQDGAVVEIRVTEAPGGGFVTGQPVIWPTWVDRSSHVIVPLRQALADPTLPAARRQVYEQSVARTSNVVGPFLAPPVG